MKSLRDHGSPRNNTSDEGDLSQIKTKMSEETDYKRVENALIGLGEVEDQMEKAERAAEISRLKSVSKIYETRSTHIQALDKFWHIVLSQHPEFAEYIRAQDFKYLETIKDIYVSWDASTSTESDVDPGNFTITFTFDGTDDGDFPTQTVSKKFWIEQIDPEEVSKNQRKGKNSNLSDDEDDISDETERLVSENVEIVWPASYDSINPSKITDKKTTQGKKNYRAGMKSFFGFFRWTGLKPGKEFPNGDELARLFADDLFPSAVKYYTEAQRDGLEEEVDSDASEPLDLSDEESRGTKRRHEDTVEAEVRR